MTKKGIRDLCCSPKSSTTDNTSTSTSIFSSPSPSPSPSRFMFSPSRPSFSDSVMDRTLKKSEPMITKWDPNTTTYAKVTSLFYESRKEAKNFIKRVYNLQKAMHFHATENSKSDKLVRAQNLMQVAMKRLQKEFYQILSMNRAHLDPESITTVSSRTSTRSSVSEFDDVDEEDDDDRIVAVETISEVEDVSNVAMADLRLIAECMISTGYAKECTKIYKVIRKSIIDEGIYRLRVEKLSLCQVNKMDWEVLDVRIKHWLNAVDVAVRILFNGERILCDHVFASDDSIRESCFSEISKDGAMILFSFAEIVARYCSRKSMDKVFRLLDMYTAMSEHWPEIEAIFSLDSESTVKSQVLTSLTKLGESIRTGLSEFETALQKYSSKTPVAGGGIHPLTTDAMDYIVLLADYSNALSNILAEAPPPPQAGVLVPDSDESLAPGISQRFGWLILILLCKLDTKAEHYKDVALAYLFLANNLQYIVEKVFSSNLKHLLGENWLSNQEAKINRFASNYQRLGWSQVIESLQPNATSPMAPEEIKAIFKRFNLSFEEAHRKHSMCMVPDSKLRDHLKVSIANKLLPVYRDFYNTNKQAMLRERHSSHVVRFTPDELARRLSDLFFEPMSESFGSSSSASFEFSPSHAIPRLQ